MDALSQQNDPVIRLDQIEVAIAALRQEQRLFRRSGFGESLKVMQVIALQMEQRECLARLQAQGRPLPSTATSHRRLAVGRLAGRAIAACGWRLPPARLALPVEPLRSLACRARAVFSRRPRTTAVANGQPAPLRLRSRRIKGLSVQTRTTV